MKANGNLAEVTANQGAGSSWLLEGGYAARIFAVTDCTAEQNPYLELALDPVDPVTKRLMYPAAEMSGEDAWRHTFRFFVGNYQAPGIDWARYKALVEAVEGTAQNKGFKYQDVDGGEQQLAGKWVGVVFRRYGYTPTRGKHAGEYREGCELSYVCPALDAIAGKFPPKAAEPRNVRAQPAPEVVKAPSAPVSPVPAPAPAVPSQDAQVPADVYDEDIPF